MGLFSCRIPVMTAARVPGLILPLFFLCAFVVGLVWYWRHRGE
ncbi:hypothetical protein [Streptomyces sp. NPDC060027]